MIDKAIKSLGLDYFLEYAVINLENEKILKAQSNFYDFLQKRKTDCKISPLESNNIEKRIYPQKILENASSLVVILFPYFTDAHKNGNLSHYCMGEDYHISVRRNLNKIVEYISSQEKNASFYIQADIGDLNEKFFAYHSGVAMVGMNSLMISEIYGTYVNIGLIVTDIKLEEKISDKKKCDECMVCVNSCPANALGGDYSLDIFRCASYITQKKGELTKEEISILQKTKKVFGCDICQNVCHFNQNVKKISENYDIINNVFLEDLQISNKEFKKKYYDRAFSFRGKSVLIRNINAIGGEYE